MDRTSEKCALILATGCGAGYIPGAPGTYGTVAAIPLCYFVSRLGLLGGLIFIGGFLGIAVWASSEAERIFKSKDSSHIVVDEIAGFIVTLFLITWSVKSVLIGFVAFRVFDIAKPFPIRHLESRLPGGWGVVGDDLAAGVYANVVTRLVLSFL